MQSSWRKNTGTTLTLDAARKIIKSEPVCPYCNKPIQWKELSLDHIQPKSREGQNNTNNITWACFLCNRTKGALTADEYLALLDFLKDWPVMQENVLLRLRIGGAAMRRRRRYAK